MHVRDELNVRVGSGKRGKTVTQEVPGHTTPSVAKQSTRPANRWVGIANLVACAEHGPSPAAESALRTTVAHLVPALEPPTLQNLIVTFCSCHTPREHLQPPTVRQNPTFSSP